MATRVSAIVPVYNGERLLAQSLPPLAALVEAGELLEVLVADDASTDASVEVATDLGAEVVRSGTRQGPGAARNRAARSARGDVLWFVDADVVVAADAGGIVRRAFADSEVAAVLGSYDAYPAATTFLSQYKNLMHHYYHQGGNVEASTFWAGCGAVRRSAFEGAGGFDTQRFRRPSIEDIELGYRLRDRGGRIRLLPELQATHLKVWRLGNLLYTDIFCRAVPWTQLMLERGGVTNDLNVGRAERGRALVAIVWCLTLLATLAGLVPVAVPLLGVGLVGAANARLVRFFHRRKGARFAFAGLMFHQVYYLYSSTAFVLTAAHHHWRALSDRRSPPHASDRARDRGEP